MLSSVVPLFLLSLITFQFGLQVFLVVSITWTIYISTNNITPAAVAMFISSHILYHQYHMLCVYFGYEISE